jgi:autotransporter-associated beta strand protein
MVSRTIAGYSIWLLIGLCLAATAATAQSVTNLYPGTTSIYIPFVNGVETGSAPPKVDVSFGSSTTPHPFVMDTGSVGLVVSQDIYHPTGPSLGPGSITYSSSGIIELGNRYNATVNFFSGGTIVATADVPVLVVDQIACVPNPRHCTPTNNPMGVSQMGIGFGQEASGQVGGTPAANPFLNIVSTSTPGAPLPSNGYVITPSGVTLGLTAANTQGFAMVKLSSYTPYATPGAPEWLLAPSSLSVNGTVGSGAILTDTGVTGMYLSPAIGTQVQTVNLGQSVECMAACAAPGTVVQVFMPGQANPVASYSFTAGTTTGNANVQPGNALSPYFVTVDAQDPTTFVNTTVNFLNGYNYLYDATNGFVGYEYTGAVSGAYGGATPSFALQGPVNLPGGFTTSLPIYLMDVSQVYTEGSERGFLDESGVGVTISAQGVALFSGPIAGSPPLTFGGGTIVLSGQNTYTGATTIAPGATLALAASGTIAASAGLTANGIFDISQTTSGAAIATLSGSGNVNLGAQALTITNASGNFAGIIADGGLGGGSGGRLAIAAGTQTLSGVNTYTGPTTVAPGATLALAGAGSIAASAVTVSGSLDVSQSVSGGTIGALSGPGRVYLGAQALTIARASGMFAGTIADGGLDGGAGGRLVVAGGVQVLTGANTYTGGTVISGGATLAVNADAALGAASAPLTFNNGMLLALGNLTTTRPILVQGGGGVIDANGFTVSLGGSLTVDGLFATTGPFAIAPSAVLRGTGTIAMPTSVAGTLAPGNSPGTLTFTAPVTMLPGSVTQFDIDGTGTGTGAGNYGRVLVTGAANSFTAAGALAPLLRGITGSATNAYTPPLGQSFVVVSAQGGLQGSYSSLIQPAGLAAGTRFDALYSPTALALVVTPQSYGALALAGIAETSNQSAVGGALDAARPIAGLPMTAAQAALYAPLYPLSAAAIPGALESLAPTIDADGLMVWRDDWYLVSGAIGGALETRRGGQPNGQEQFAEGPKGSTVWLTALGQFQNIGSANGVPGYSGSTGGVVAGVDMPALPWLTAGAALAFTSPQVSTKNSQTLSGQALQVTAYASAHQGIFFVDGQFGGLFFQDTTQRPLPVFGVQTNGQTSGTGVGGAIRAGADLHVAAWQVEPSLGLAGLGLSRGSFTETQAGVANLSIGSQGLTSIQSVLAARAERRFPLGETMAVLPTARIGWLHEFADTVGTATASFAGGAPFSVESAPIGRDAALIGLGATVQTSGPVSLFLAYNGAFAQNANAQTITGGISVKW